MELPYKRIRLNEGFEFSGQQVPRESTSISLAAHLIQAPGAIEGDWDLETRHVLPPSKLDFRPQRAMATRIHEMSRPSQ